MSQIIRPENKGNRSFTFLFLIAFGIPVGAMVAQLFDVENFWGSFFIMVIFAVVGGFIGLSIDKKIELKEEAKRRDI